MWRGRQQLTFSSFSAMDVSAQKSDVLSTLIALVHSHPNLWRRSSLPASRTAPTWQSIFDLLVRRFGLVVLQDLLAFNDHRDVKKKWKGLRDRYLKIRRESLHNENRSKAWEWFDHLRFLDEVVTGKNLTTVTNKERRLESKSDAAVSIRIKKGLADESNSTRRSRRHRLEHDYVEEAHSLPLIRAKPSAVKIPKYSAPSSSTTRGEAFAKFVQCCLDQLDPPDQLDAQLRVTQVLFEFRNRDVSKKGKGNFAKSTSGDQTNDNAHASVKVEIDGREQEEESGEVKCVGDK